MGTSPTSQKFRTVFDFGIPASFLTNNDVLNALNSIPGYVFDDALAGVLTIDKFVSGNLSVSGVQVTQSHWEVGTQDSTKAVLVSTMNITSDPISANDLAAIIFGIGALIVSAILFVFGPVGWGIDIIILALAAVGVLTLIAVTVSEITQPGPAGTLLSGAVLVGAIGLGIVFVSSIFKKR